MKKLFLFIAAASLAMASCSSDDSGSSSNDVVKFTVDGVTKTYKYVTVTPDGGGYLTVTASNSASSTTDFIVLEIEEGNVGPEAPIDYVNYFAAGDSFYAYGGDDFTSNTEINSSSKLKGTFEGTIFSNSGSATKAVTNGSFNISY